MEKEKGSAIAGIIQLLFPQSKWRKVCIYFAVANVLWLCGSWNISFAWIILVASIYILGKYHLRKRKGKKDFRKMIEPALQQGENATWLNTILSQMWPLISEYTQSTLKEIVESEVQKKLPTALRTLYLEKIDLGQKPPLIANVRSYQRSEGMKRSEYTIDVDVTYNGDAQVKLAYRKLKLGISDFQIHGPLRIIMTPFPSENSLVGGIVVFFLKRPKIAFDLTNLLNVLDFPGLKKSLRGIVDDAVADFIVLPNRIAIPLAEGVDACDLQYPIPEGLLRVTIIEARELSKSDRCLIGDGIPDSYVVLEVGAQTFRTEVKSNNANPEWNQTFEAFVDSSEGQELEIFLYDHDLTSKDCKIGCTAINLSSVVEEGFKDLWLPLEGKPGKVHLKLEWFPLSSDPLHFRYTKEKESVAVLIVKLIRAENFPKRTDSVVRSKFFCRANVGEVTLESFRFNDELKEWKQSLRFLLTDPHEEANIEVFESSTAGNKSFGSMVFVARKLIEEPDMSLQGSFPLKNSSANERLVCKFTLRALKSAACSSVGAGTLKRGHQKCHVNGSCSQRARPTAVVTADTEAPYGPSASENNSSGTTGTSSGSVSSPSGSIADEFIPEQSGEATAVAAATKDYASRGVLTLKIVYDHRRNRLVVAVVSAKNLLSLEPLSKTNPYVQISLRPTRSKKCVRRTATFPGSVNPIYNASFDYVIGLDQLADKHLDVAVKNNRLVKLPAKRRDVIGCTTIKLCELSLSDGIIMNCELSK